MRISKDEQECKINRDLVTMDTLIPITQHRAKSRRSSSIVSSNNNNNNTSITVSSNGGILPTSILGDDDNPIMTDMTIKHVNSTRLRRKSSRAGGKLSSSSSMAVLDETNTGGSESISKMNHVNLNDTTTTTAGGDGVPPITHDDEIAHIRDKVVTLAAREMDEHEGLDEASLREHEEVTKVKNVAQVQIGPYIMDTWYFSPLPKELFKESNISLNVTSVTPHSVADAYSASDNNNNQNHNSSTSSSNIPITTAITSSTVSSTSNILPILYVCEFSLQFFARKEELLRYQARANFMKCRRHPPGNEIYRSYTNQGHLLSMFEVDGLEAKTYCQNLCYIGAFENNQN